MNPQKIVVAEYSENWPLAFEDLKKVYQDTLGDLLIDIQRVGSTSVPGLPAKPILDIDLVIENRTILPAVISKLESLGYEYQGDLGIKDRESFKRISDRTPTDGSDRTWQKHHLYCCNRDSTPLRNHLQFRDYLRRNPEAATQYGKLKRDLASQAPDIDFYVDGKTNFITEILKHAGFDSTDLETITAQNKMK
jgi:GrpB-like predicted nucleotidyltransferase (UPF0157 family)